MSSGRRRHAAICRCPGEGTRGFEPSWNHRCHRRSHDPNLRTPRRCANAFQRRRLAQDRRLRRLQRRGSTRRSGRATCMGTSSAQSGLIRRTPGFTRCIASRLMSPSAKVIDARARRGKNFAGNRLSGVGSCSCAMRACATHRRIDNGRGIDLLCNPARAGEVEMMQIRKEPLHLPAQTASRQATGLRHVAVSSQTER